jgi:hypothetical protein
MCRLAFESKARYTTEAVPSPKRQSMVCVEKDVKEEEEVSEWEGEVMPLPMLFSDLTDEPKFFFLKISRVSLPQKQQQLQERCGGNRGTERTQT